MMGDFITRVLLMVMGYAYPALQCFKLLEKRKADNKELRFWCQFWIIMAILTVLERVADVVISWLPLYGELKLAFTIYLWYPKTQGTVYIYETLLRPFIADYETDFDAKLQICRTKSWELSVYFMENFSDLSQTLYFKFLEHLANQSGNSPPPVVKKNKNKNNPIPLLTFFKPVKRKK